MVPPFLDSYDFIILLGLLNSPTRVPNWRYREYRLFKGASRRRKTLPLLRINTRRHPFWFIRRFTCASFSKRNQRRGHYPPSFDLVFKSNMVIPTNRGCFLALLFQNHRILM